VPSAIREVNAQTIQLSQGRSRATQIEREIEPLNGFTSLSTCLALRS